MLQILASTIGALNFATKFKSTITLDHPEHQLALIAPTAAKVGAGTWDARRSLNFHASTSRILQLEVTWTFCSSPMSNGWLFNAIVRRVVEVGHLIGSDSITGRAI